jgi:putative DNA primase/helicase
LAENNTGQAADDRALFAQVAAFMQAHSSTRFPDHDADQETLARHHQRAGFRYVDEQGDMQFWVMSEPFKKELCKGFQTLAAVRAMVKAKWMQVGDVEGGKQRSTRQKRIKALNSTKMNVYVLTSAALEGDE